MSELLEAELKNRAELAKTKPKVLEKCLNFPEKLARGESCAVIQLQYRYTCSFHCEHCSITNLKPKPGDRIFTLADIRELSRQAHALGLSHIDISGGEPLGFYDLDELVEAIDPSLFYILIGTNGWALNKAKAVHLKGIGVDKIQLSIDSLNAYEHDAFRHAPGSHERCMKAIDFVLEAGLKIEVATVVGHDRLYSEEFIQFLDYMKAKGCATVAMWPKPLGEWANNFEILTTPEDSKYLESLRERYDIHEHLSPAYGIDVGCLAVKRQISITQSGEVLPCPWIHTSLGNFFDTPLATILEDGMKRFGARCSTCRSIQKVKIE